MNERKDVKTKKMSFLLIVGLLLLVCALVAPAIAQDVPETSCPTDLNSCTAKDVVTNLTNFNILSNDCLTEGNITLNITAEFSANADRYDVGMFVAYDNGTLSDNPTAASCLGTYMSIPPFTDLDSGVDECGDIQSKGIVSETFEMTVSCDNYADGYLTLSSCRFWKQPGANIICPDVPGPDAGTGSKCDCTPFTLAYDPCEGYICNDGNACTDDSCVVEGGAPTCDYSPKAAGTACGDPSDTICDDPDTCDSTGACQVNHEPITMLCREDAGECDLEEYCDGNGSCPPDTFEDCTEWCGLTQGFWKENTNKYLSAWTSGRQVCDQYFENTAPSDVCNVISSSPCSCGSDPTCENWGCIYEVFSKAKPKDMTKIQMMALYMTQEYHVTGTEEPFYIDCTKFQEECSASLPTDICGEGDKAASIIDIWTYLQSIDDTQPSTAASLANCLNNYNDAQCSDTVEYPDCESVTDPATFDGLPGCGFGTKQVKIMLN